MESQEGISKIQTSSKDCVGKYVTILIIDSKTSFSIRRRRLKQRQSTKKLSKNDENNPTIPTKKNRKNDKIKSTFSELLPKHFEKHSVDIMKQIDDDSDAKDHCMILFDGTKSKLENYEIKINGDTITFGNYRYQMW